MVFTYHHSRAEGWSAVLDALYRSGFCAVAAHPIKAEMAVAMPKVQAKEPIDLDIILACRKAAPGEVHTPEAPGSRIAHHAREQIARLTGRGRRLSRNDVRVIVMARALCALSGASNEAFAMAALQAW